MNTAGRRGHISPAPWLGDSRFQAFYTCVGWTARALPWGTGTVRRQRCCSRNCSLLFLSEMHGMSVEYFPFSRPWKELSMKGHSYRDPRLSSVKCRELFPFLAQPLPLKPGSRFILLSPLSTRNDCPFSIFSDLHHEGYSHFSFQKKTKYLIVSAAMTKAQV